LPSFFETQSPRYLHIVSATFFLLFVASGHLAAQEADYGAQRAQALLDLSAAEAAAKAAETDCVEAWEAVGKYIGPVSNPLEPRDETCSVHIAKNGERLDGFGQCSATYFTAYDEAHNRYRQCFDRQMGAAIAVIDLRKKDIELDQLARVAAREIGNAPAEQNGQKGWLGIRYSGVSGSYMRNAGLPDQEGVLVTSVREGSPASKAGVSADDIVRAINHHQIIDQKEFRTHARALLAGDIVVLDLIRAGQRRFTYILVEER
jgi:hypothetical protein